MGAEARLQEPGDRRPCESSRHPGEQSEWNLNDGGQPVDGVGDEDPRQSPYIELPLGSDVEQAGAKSERNAKAKDLIESVRGLLSARGKVTYVERNNALLVFDTRANLLEVRSAVRELDGRTQEAVEGVLTAAPSFAQDPKFQYALGITCMNAGKGAEAEAAFKKAVELDPANPEPYFHLATIAVGAKTCFA